jgi:hypothetical protein
MYLDTIFSLYFSNWAWPNYSISFFYFLFPLRPSPRRHFLPLPHGLAGPAHFLSLPLRSPAHGLPFFSSLASPPRGAAASPAHLSPCTGPSSSPPPSLADKRGLPVRFVPDLGASPRTRTRVRCGSPSREASGPHAKARGRPYLSAPCPSFSPKPQQPPPARGNLAPKLPPPCLGRSPRHRSAAFSPPQAAAEALLWHKDPHRPLFSPLPCLLALARPRIVPEPPLAAAPPLRPISPPQEPLD